MALVYALVAACGALVAAELFYEKHPHFDFERWFGFYAWFGFIVCTCIVMLGILLRRIVKRDEDYYDRQP